MQIVTEQLKRYPQNAGLHFFLGRLYTMDKKYTTAEKHFRQAIALDAGKPEPYLFLARMQWENGGKDDAARTYEQVLTKNPYLVEPRMHLAIYFEDRGKSKQAADHYRKILYVRPEFAPAANNLAWYLAENTEDLGEALRLALVAKSGAPNDPKVADTLGWIHFKRGSYDLALSQFNQAAKDLSDNPTILFHLGLALAANGEKDAAAEALAGALQLQKDFPEAPQARLRLAELERTGR